MRSKLLMALPILFSFILSGCGTNSEPTNPGHTHQFSSEWSSNDSYHWHECMGCNEISDKASHDFDDLIVDVPAGETTYGSGHYICSVCDYRKNVSINPTGHTHHYSDTWSHDATNHWHECSCGDKKDEGAHTFGAWVTTNQPTVGVEGTKQRTCSTCGYVETASIPALEENTSLVLLAFETKKDTTSRHVTNKSYRSAIFKDEIELIDYKNVSLEATVYNENRDSFVDLVLYLSWLDTFVVYNEGNGEYQCSVTTTFEGGQWVSKISMLLELGFDEDYYSRIEIQEIQFLHGGTGNMKASLSDERTRTIEYGYVGVNNVVFGDNEVYTCNSQEGYLDFYKYLYGMMTSSLVEMAGWSDRIIDEDNQICNFLIQAAHEHNGYQALLVEATFMEYWEPTEYKDFAIITAVPNTQNVTIPSKFIFKNYSGVKELDVRGVHLQATSYATSLDTSVQRLDYNEVESIYVPDSVKYLYLDEDWPSLTAIDMPAIKFDCFDLRSSEMPILSYEGNKNYYNVKEDGRVYLKARGDNDFFLIAVPEKPRDREILINDGVFHDMDYYDNLQNLKGYKVERTHIISENTNPIYFTVGDLNYKVSMDNLNEVTCVGLANTIPTQFLQTGYINTLTIPDSIDVTLHDNGIYANYHCQKNNLSIPESWEEAYPVFNGVNDRWFDFSIGEDGTFLGDNLPGTKGSNIIDPTVVNSYVTSRVDQINYFKLVKNISNTNQTLHFDVTALTGDCNGGVRAVLGLGTVKDTYGITTFSDKPPVEATIKNVVLGNNIRDIRKSYLLESPYGVLESITFPNSVKNIYGQKTSAKNISFEEGSNLEYLSLSAENAVAIDIPDSVTTCFLTLGTSLRSITFGEGITTWSNPMQSNGYSETYNNATNTFVINGATHDKEYEQNNYEYLLYRVFGVNEGLEEVIVNSNVESLPDQFVAGCVNLTSVTLPQSLKTIGRDAFSFCRSLEEITIPKNVETIYCAAFYGCESLETINFEGTMEEWNAIQLNIFKQVNYHYDADGLHNIDWNHNVPATVVHCSNGDVPIQN